MRKLILAVMLLSFNASASSLLKYDWCYNLIMTETKRDFICSIRESCFWVRRLQIENKQGKAILPMEVEIYTGVCDSVSEMREPNEPISE